MAESQPFTEEDVERYAARLCAMVCDYARDINPPLALDDCPLVNAHVTDVRALLASLCRDGRFLPPDCDVTNELAVLGEVDADPRRLPTKRPGWLGEWQTWPCGRCGREVDDVVPHDCAEPVLDVQAGTDSAPPSDQELTEGNTP